MARLVRHYRLPHLYAKNIIDSPLCCCGDIVSNFHFLFTCSDYSVIRTKLMNDVLGIRSPVDLDTLLFGNTSLNDDDNSTIFLCVKQYITESKQFGTKDKDDDGDNEYRHKNAIFLAVAVFCYR
ncbi:hypothetical protein DPMN_084174 [Dreissena polymorpha]|uniref:Reverse transcriptase n=1 Tax=Dreissena polymorpha TaxID=45954 RepID=A0A9D4BKL6_DREPO|nr:hypothetical protein DPMN_084174 [Dreissena polymorpha]